MKVYSSERTSKVHCCSYHRILSAKSPKTKARQASKKEILAELAGGLEENTPPSPSLPELEETLEEQIEPGPVKIEIGTDGDSVGAEVKINF